MEKVVIAEILHDLVTCIYLNNNNLSLVIQAGYEDGNIAEQIHNPCYCLYLHYSLNKLINGL